MIKKLFCGILAATLCIYTGCSANKSLSNKEIDKNNTSETQNTVNTSNTKPSASIPAKEHPADIPQGNNQTTTSTNTQTPSATGTEINLNSELKKELNNFFTAIAKARVPAFEKDKLSSNDLIMFGIRYNFIYNRQALEKYEIDKSMAKLPEKHVDTAVEKYFGLKLKSHSISTEDFSYANGYYLLPYNLKIANTFAQVDKLVDEGSDIYSTDLTLYAPTEGFSGDPNGSPKEWKQLGKMPKVFMKIKAKIKKVNGGYILIEYLRV